MEAFNMSESLEIWEKPKAEQIYMLAGWRQWADAGSISSSLPQYLIKQTGAKKIGEIRPDGYYLFQFPGTHDLVRPIVKFDEGYPEALQVRKNELYYADQGQYGLVIFVGEEPHLDAERYVGDLLDAAEALSVKRIVGFGGVYGELPYDKERMVSSIYSLPKLREELEGLAVNLSDYHGGASIGSYICKRAGERGIEFVSFYAFVPTYDFSGIAQISNSIRIENDYKAWFGVMRRVNYMLKLTLDLSDLEKKSEHLVELVDAKVEELEGGEPGLGVRDYLKRISDEFTETTFNPLDEVWEEELRRLSDKFDSAE
jgi:proteasome assembly chaperone (PAC2) family protein